MKQTIFYLIAFFGMLAGGVCFAQSTEGDLCAACCASNQCLSGLCYSPNPNSVPTCSGGLANSFCTQICSSNTDCPSSMQCLTPNGITQSICVVGNINSCNSYPGPAINEQCYWSSAGLYRACQGANFCYQFASQDGYCLNRCVLNDSTQQCAPGYHCTVPPSSQSPLIGGCFQNVQTGSSCNLPDQWDCDSNSRCITTNVSTTGSPQSSSSYYCYDLCTSGSGCNDGGACYSMGYYDPAAGYFSDNSGNVTDGNGNAVVGTSYGLCCQRNNYADAQPLTCLPPSACRYNVGVSCTQNSDCLQGLCENYNNQKVCSMSCTVDTDCPAAGTGLNSDGVTPNAGCSCQNIANRQLCWPRQQPSAPPSGCSTTASTSPSKSGCQQSDLLESGWAILGLLLYRFGGDLKKKIGRNK